MTTRIRYRLLDETEAESANEWVNEQPELAVLDHYNRNIFFWTGRSEPIDDRVERKPPDVDPGRGFVEIGDLCSIELDEVCPPLVALFGRLHDEFDVAVEATSGGLQRKYFSEAELRTITDDGAALVGDPGAHFRTDIYPEFP